METYAPSLDRAMLTGLVSRFLAEDIGTGDITTAVMVAPDAFASAALVFRTPGVVAGLPAVVEVYRQLSPEVTVMESAHEGDLLEAGATAAVVQGPARPILTGERVALNLLQRLSGVATLTRRFVDAVEGAGARIADTRKTTPGLRALEKYAVAVGGGHNHRMGLYDAVMIKDNHIAAAGSIAEAVARARRAIPHTMTITVECDRLEQVDEALAAGADILLLDNMTDDVRAEAASRCRGRAVAEASGGITLETARRIAETGVQVLSVGALTHSAPALDIGMDFHA
ncbi:MAG: carboxylating nicotinate-nucleotide diphosphorylase [Armatimonadetes bacterium]|nr:carboxylating nicotinate-nucleotide diphosphorylase [Armatimonadota bacterium]